MYRYGLAGLFGSFSQFLLGWKEGQQQCDIVERYRRPVAELGSIGGPFSSITNPHPPISARFCDPNERSEPFEIVFIPATHSRKREREKQFFSNYPTSPDIRIDYCNLN